MAIGFLFDPYKPEFWYFEVIETIYRLAMTGVLSTISPPARTLSSPLASSSPSRTPSSWASLARTTRPVTARSLS